MQWHTNILNSQTRVYFLLCGRRSARPGKRKMETVIKGHQLSESWDGSDETGGWKRWQRTWQPSPCKLLLLTCLVLVSITTVQSAYFTTAARPGKWTEIPKHSWVSCLFNQSFECMRKPSPSACFNKEQCLGLINTLELSILGDREFH